MEGVASSYYKAAVLLVGPCSRNFIRWLSVPQPEPNVGQSKCRLDMNTQAMRVRNDINKKKLLMPAVVGLRPTTAHLDGLLGLKSRVWGFEPI